MRDQFDCDDNFAEILGYERSSFGSTFDDIVARVPEVDRKLMRQRFEQILAQGNELSIEYELPTRTGRRLRLLARGSIQRDAGGRPLLLYGGLMEISRLHATVEMAAAG